MAAVAPRTRAYASIVSSIRDDLFQRRLAPGDRLPSEEALAERFGVSRSVVREALRVLELQGLVAVRHGYGGGAFVTEVSTSPVSAALETVLRLELVEPGELHEARLLMEPTIARSAAARIQAEDLDQLAQNLRRSQRALEAGEDGFEHSLAFHDLIAAASRNPVFGLVMQALTAALTRLGIRYTADPSVSRRVLEEHHAIFESLRSGDPDRAADLMADHLERLPQPRLADSSIKKIQAGVS